MPNNAHRLLFHPSEDCLLSRTKLSERQEQQLKAARDEIRQCIRTALRNWPDYLENGGNIFVEAARAAGKIELIARFRMQGSMQYGTANSPAHRPPQEVDLDDGMFLPAPSIQAAGEESPALLVGGLFEVVEAALAHLCQKRGWTIEQKPTCVRVKLPERDHSHVDVPIYAVPQARYQEIALNLAKALNESQGGEAVFRQDDVELLEEAYRSLASEEIMLAHREEGWMRSDPRRLEDWFDAARNRYGRQLRRMCRLIKAWRDFQFEHGGPSSIALMWCVVQVYDRHGHTLDAGRDDMALLQIANELPALLGGPIDHPVPGCPALDESWTPELRATFVAAAERLQSAMQSAMNQADSPQKVVAAFETQFGARLPDNPLSMIEIDPALAATVASLLNELDVMPRPLPKTQKSQSERRYA